MKNRVTKTGFLLLLMWGITSMLFAQKEIKLTPEQERDVQISKDYFYGDGWDNTDKEKAIRLALEELKRNLIDEKLPKDYSIARLECDEGYFFMVFIKKNDNNHEINNNNHENNNNNHEINELINTKQFEEFYKKYKSYNRQNKLFASNDKSDMNDLGNCYVAIFKGEEMEVFLDYGASSRKDLISGKIIEDFEKKYNSNKFITIWIELIK